jgi:hypothetical protein
VSERESVKAVTETVGEVVEVQTKSFDRAVAEPFYDMSGAGRRTDPVGASIAAETYRKALEIPGPSIRHGAGAMLQAATLPSDIKMVAELTAAVITKTVSFADWSLTAIAFSASRSSYRRQVLKLAQKAGSDISFLINPTTKRYWGRPTGWDMSYLQSHPEIWEAAHVISDKSGQPGPLIVMSAYYNQLAAQTVEGRHGLELYVKLSEALEIGGVLVDPATARDWVKAGHITQAVFDQAKRVDLSGL